MATIGLKCFLHAPLAEGEKSYTKEAEKLAGAIEVKVDITKNDAKLYADDILSDNDESFLEGKITLGIDDDDDKIFAPLLGKTISQTGEVVSKSDDKAIFVGFGYITGKKGKGKRKCKAKFYPKVTFQDFETESKTKQDKLEYTTPSVEGTIYELADGTWKKEKTCDTIDEATEYLKSCFTQLTP